MCTTAVDNSEAEPSPQTLLDCVVAPFRDSAMGCCCSKGTRENGVEMGSNVVVNDALTCKLGARAEGMKISAGENGFNVVGAGIVLGSCPLDCDTARWEVIVQRLDPNAGSESSAAQIGVMRYSAKKNVNLSKSLEDYGDNAESPSWWLKGVSLKEGDVIGVYWDQTDLPMLSFTRNGQLLGQSCINRIRPSSEIFPAVSLAGASSVTVIFDDDGFRFPPLTSKFKMILCSSSII